MSWGLFIILTLVAWCVYAYTDRNTERAFRRYNGKALGDLLHDIAERDARISEHNKRRAREQVDATWSRRYYENIMKQHNKGDK